MKKLGVVGGIASGKSQVSKTFESWGAHRIDGDELGHQVLKQEEVCKRLHDRWGDRVLNENRELDRRAIAAIVFAEGRDGSEALQFLEGITHPRISRLIGDQIELAERQGQIAVVIDAAIMLKAGWAHHCDVLVFVDASRSVRLQRAMKRGWTEVQFDAREAQQWPVEQKRAHCQFVVNNGGSLESMKQQAAEVWTQIVGHLPEPRRG